MQLSQASLFAAAAFLSSVSAENLLVVVNSDIGANLADYLSYRQAHTTEDYGPLLSLYEEGQTYTDDSYTTLVGSAEMSSLSAFATALPWYSSRILPQLDASVTSAAASVTSAPNSSSPTSSAHNSSTITESSVVNPTSGTESSTGNSSHNETSASSDETSVSTAGAAAVVGQGALAVVIGLGALALL